MVESTSLRGLHIGEDAGIPRVSLQDWYHCGLTLGYSIACSPAHGLLEERSGSFIDRTWEQAHSLDLEL